jgi:hypothetical protein
VKELRQEADTEKQEVETQAAEELKRRETKRRLHEAKLRRRTKRRLDEIDRKTAKAINLATREAAMKDAEDNRVRIDSAAAAAHDTKQRASGVTKEAVDETKKRKRDVADKREVEDKALSKLRLAEDKAIEETHLARQNAHAQATEEERVTLEAKDKSDAATKQDVDEKTAEWNDAQGM